MQQTHSKQDGSFLQQIKEQTSSLHTALEQNQLSTNLMAADVDLVHYATYLAAMKEVIAYTETTIFPALKNIIPDVEERRKIKSIESDLATLSQHIPITPFEKFKLPAASFSEAFALGVMYVIEGSTLGGRVIIRHLQLRPNITTANAFDFFSGYGEQTGIRWKNFLAALSTYGETSPHQHEIIEGAKQAFQSIDHHFALAPTHA